MRYSWKATRGGWGLWATNVSLMWSMMRSTTESFVRNPAHPRMSEVEDARKRLEGLKGRQFSKSSPGRLGCAFDSLLRH